jgi:hypothetical protein
MTAAAQEVVPRAEVFGGFSISSTDFGGVTRESMWGWQGAVNGNVRSNLGLVADFGGQYKDVAGTSLRVHQYLFGPRVFARREKITAFGHALFGGARASAAGVSANGFAMGFGGGLDVNVSDRIAVRVPQFDWVPNRFSGVWDNSTVRIGIGIVIKAGSSN